MMMWDGIEDARQLANHGVEVWSPVHIAPNRYFVSNLGRVMSDLRGRGFTPLALTPNGEGRCSVGIYVHRGDKSAQPWLVYRLVLHAFDGPPPSPLHTDACHGVGGVLDNRLCNLRWGTRSENNHDTLRHKREKTTKETVQTGERSYRVYEWHDGSPQMDNLIGRSIEAYNQKQITIEGIAIVIGCSREEAYNVVKGKSKTGHVIEGRAASNAREGEHHYRAVCTDEDLEQAFEMYVKNHWSGVRFAEFLGMKQVTAHAILSGRNRRNVPRPEGFEYPWPDASTMNAKGRPPE